MGDYYTKEDVAGKLQKKTDEINVRLDGLKLEIEHTGERLIDIIKKRPVAVAVVAVIAGVLLGLLIRKGGKRSSAELESYRKFLGTYMDTIIDEAGTAVPDGEGTEEAVERAIRNKAPLFIYAPQSENTRRRRFALTQNLISSFGRQFVQSAALALGDVFIEHLRSERPDTKRDLQDADSADSDHAI